MMEKPIEPQNEIQKRIQNLEKDEYSTEISEELAYREEGFREELKEKEMPKKNIGDMADKISTIELEKMELQEAGFTDPMTGLKNTRAFFKESEKTILDFKREEQRKEKKEEKKDFSILIFDIDHFKNVNDTYGHKDGDEALKTVANIIKKNIRESDCAYRYGGEEFVVILPKTNSSEAFNVAEKIRRKVEEESIKISEGRELKINVSIGIFGTDQEEIDTIDEMFKKADDALYFSKENGRNKSTVFDENVSRVAEERKKEKKT